VGQPQDVGLIFLSSMATGVANIGREVSARARAIVRACPRGAATAALGFPIAASRPLPL
jgi:hypothetical protein